MGIELKIADASNGKKMRNVTGIILSVYREGKKSGLNPPKGSKFHENASQKKCLRLQFHSQWVWCSAYKSGTATDSMIFQND